MNALPPYKIFPLGDTALVVDFGNVIDEKLNKIVHSLFIQLKNNPIDGIIETVPGYSSLTIYYDVLAIKQKLKKQTTVFEWINENVESFLYRHRKKIEIKEALVKVPVCYEEAFAPDLNFIAEQNKISTEEIIHLHTSTTYRIYMLGFLPGFAYMGQVDEKIACPRKPQPAFVEAGSVGIAGKQTGIYPLRSPGGWQIIGRTPLRLFDKDKEEPTFFKPGDTVQFYSITREEFIHLKNNSPLLEEGG